jgi:hypothetical protein
MNEQITSPNNERRISKSGSSENGLKRISSPGKFPFLLHHFLKCLELFIYFVLMLFLFLFLFLFGLFLFFILVFKQQKLKWVYWKEA